MDKFVHVFSLNSSIVIGQNSPGQIQIQWDRYSLAPRGHRIELYAPLAIVNGPIAQARAGAGGGTGH